MKWILRSLFSPDARLVNAVDIKGKMNAESLGSNYYVFPGFAI